MNNASKVVSLKPHDNRNTMGPLVHELPFGIKSTMPARVLAPNHIQFQEEHEPPNDDRNATSMDLTKRSYSQGDGRVTEEDMVDIVNETPHV
jgi:hypothetical protein